MKIFYCILGFMAALMSGLCAVIALACLCYISEVWYIGVTAFIWFVMLANWGALEADTMLRRSYYADKRKM